MTPTYMKHPYLNFNPVTQKLLTPQKHLIHWLSALTCSNSATHIIQLEKLLHSPPQNSVKKNLLL